MTYFASFQSFNDTQLKAKGAAIVITIDGDKEIVSSGIPRELINEAFNELIGQLEARLPVTIWTHSSSRPKLTVVPYERVKMIEIVYHPKD